jgi:hypothetical protein
MQPATFNPTAARLGGCLSCTWSGHRVDVAVWCDKPGHGHVSLGSRVRLRAWMREPGADDDLLVPASPRVCIASALLWGR